jgi:hypothetical protein
MIAATDEANKRGREPTVRGDACITPRVWPHAWPELWPELWPDAWPDAGLRMRSM